MTKYIAIIQTGKPIDPVLKKIGDFDSFFIKHMEIDITKTKTFRVYETLEFPEIEKLAGIIITGSPSMVTYKLDWSEKTIDWLKQFLDLEIPILGVCYGHQMLARLLGGVVDWNPNGRQIGRIQMQLTKAAASDLLFSSVIEKNQNSISFNATHLQSITRMPNDVVLLGSTELDPNHSFRYKNHIWGLQFHPEFNSEIISEYIQFRSKFLNQEGFDTIKLLAQIENHDNGKRILNRFKNICFNS